MKKILYTLTIILSFNFCFANNSVISINHETLSKGKRVYRAFNNAESFILSCKIEQKQTKSSANSGKIALFVDHGSIQMLNSNPAPIVCKNEHFSEGDQGHCDYQHSNHINFKFKVTGDDIAPERIQSHVEFAVSGDNQNEYSVTCN